MVPCAGPGSILPIVSAVGLARHVSRVNESIRARAECSRCRLRPLNLLLADHVLVGFLMLVLMVARRSRGCGTDRKGRHRSNLGLCKHRLSPVRWWIEAVIH